METLKKVLLWIGGGILALFLGFFVLAFVVFLVSTISASSNSRYWIDLGDETLYTNAYEEKDGCLYFRDNVYDRDYKVCKMYSVSDRGER